MAVGDMKYKFMDLDNNEQEIVIPAEVLRKGKRAGMNNRQTIMKYAYDQGFNVEKPKETEKKTTSKRTRKPNEIKANLITTLQESLQAMGEVNVINPERQVQVVIDGVTYEFTLVQKRAPKQ